MENENKSLIIKVKKYYFILYNKVNIFFTFIIKNLAQLT